jgi:methionyl-tRNA formyltransferase
MPLRLVFMGTAELARASLKALLASPHFDVAAIVTQPDRPKGRDLKPHPSPVKVTALEAGLPVLQPERARDGVFLSSLLPLAPDVIVVAAYGQILPPSILELPRFGCVNVHASLLPKYRGAAPIQWAILDNETETGVTIMRMAAGLDTGDILTKIATPIGLDENADELHDRLAVLGSELLASTLPDYCAGVITPTPQDNAAATYARKISREDGRMDWSQTAQSLRNRIRAFTPWPGAYADLVIRGKPRLVKFGRASVEEVQGQPGQVLRADRNGIVMACGTDSLRIEQLQLEGGRKMTAAEFLAGHPLEHLNRNNSDQSHR